jgi:DNA topoisomerase-1
VARLRRVDCSESGITRRRRGKGFEYLDQNGNRIEDTDALARINQLAIPPAWQDVWICRFPMGHIQATGIDARGRKQYRYHAEWRRARDADKFARLREFGAVLPRIRRRVRRDLARHDSASPGREAVLAALVRLLDTTLVRIGNDEYVRANGSYGLTTLRNRHAAVQGGSLRLRFKGKHGKLHDVKVDDPRVARIVGRCQALPGQDLFEYLDDSGTVRGVGSGDVNDYLREVAGADVTAKDFRTWHATVLALALATHVADAPRPSANEVLAEVAARLGNTVAVCRKAYVHPGVLALAQQVRPPDEVHAARRPAGLSAAEAQLMDFLRRAQDERGSSSRGVVAASVKGVGGGSSSRRTRSAAA